MKDRHHVPLKYPVLLAVLSPPVNWNSNLVIRKRFPTALLVTKRETFSREHSATQEEVLPSSFNFFCYNRSKRSAQIQTYDKKFISNISEADERISRETLGDSFHEQRRGGGISWKCVPRNGSIFQSNAVSRGVFKRVLLDVQLPAEETHCRARAS